jgi:DNA-binding GntR family transcriptional regulator
MAVQDASPRRGRRPGYAQGMTNAQSVPLARGASRLNHAVYDQLKERLLEGRYAAGERLSTEALRMEFEVLPQVGSRVTTYDLREVEDFFHMFGGFEGSIAGIAATRRTNDQLADLDMISHRIGSLRAETDATVRARGYRIWNRRFHEAIHVMAHSRIMAETSRRMWDLSDFLINTTGVPQPLSSALDERHDDHEQIREALHDGDANSARERMERHIVNTVAVIHAERDATAN